MTKKDFMDYLEKELKDVPDDANIIIDTGWGDITCTGGLTVSAVCGRFQAFMPYYCVRPPNHDGSCYCACKSVDFEPDTEEQIKKLYDSIK
jgi:hypothetical protein